MPCNRDLGNLHTRDHDLHSSCRKGSPSRLRWRPEDLYGGIIMMVTCCFAHVLVAKAGISVLCVLVAALGASLLVSLRCLSAPRAGSLEQLWSLYGSFREERMIVRAGETGYQAAAVRMGMAYLLCWCQLALLAALLRYVGPDRGLPRLRRHAEALGDLAPAVGVPQGCIALADATELQGQRSDPCRRWAGEPLEWLRSRRLAGSSPG
jgi:hypothetical protein